MEQNDQDQINEIQQFHADLFESNEAKKSIKEQIETLQSSLTSIQNEQDEKLTRIKSYYSKLFESSATRKSIEEEIGEYYKQLFQDSETSPSIKTEINLIFQNIKKEYETFSTQSSKATLFHNKLFLEQEGSESIEKSIDTFYDKLFIDGENKKSFNTQFESLLQSLDDRYNIANNKIKRLEDFYSSVFEDKKTEEGTVTKQSLTSSIDSQKQRLDNLIKKATEQLYALTDSSLHNAFAKRAKEYTDEFGRLETLTHKLTWAVIIDIVFFGILQFNLITKDKGFNYHILIYQFSIAGAIFFAIWMFNRNQKIAKKLAEEYHHKAAIAEAMTGYRHLYDLEHEDGEYMELFNSLKDQLNINPSKSIDKFLNLKSPQEEVTETFKNTFNTDKLRELAEALKPLLKPGE
jgi:uncharacterized membrane-anchored protein YjiN (DUF445 family)